MIDMLGIARAGRQLVFSFLQRVLPLGGVGAQVRLRVGILEAAAQQFLNGRRQHEPRRGMGTWLEGSGTLPGIRPATRRDPRRDRVRFAIARARSREWMHTLHEQLKDQHRQGEGVVFRPTVHLRERSPLQFRGRVIRPADATAVETIAARRLKRIRVD